MVSTKFLTLRFKHTSETMPAIRVWVEPRHIACIGVAVRVAVGNFEQDQEIVAVGQGGIVHFILLKLMGY